MIDLGVRTPRADVMTTMNTGPFVYTAPDTRRWTTAYILTVWSVACVVLNGARVLEHVERSWPGVWCASELLRVYGPW